MATQAAAYTLIENFGEMFRVFAIGAILNLPRVIDIPISKLLDLAISDDDRMRRWEAHYVLVERFLGVRYLDGEILANHSFVRFLRRGWIFKECVEFRTEKEPAAVPVVNKWFIARHISRTEEMALALIPNSKRKVTDDLLRTL